MSNVLRTHTNNSLRTYYRIDLTMQNRLAVCSTAITAALIFSTIYEVHLYFKNGDKLTAPRFLPYVSVKAIIWILYLMVAIWGALRDPKHELIIIIAWATIDS